MTITETLGVLGFVLSIMNLLIKLYEVWRDYTRHSKETARDQRQAAEKKKQELVEKYRELFRHHAGFATWREKTQDAAKEGLDAETICDVWEPILMAHMKNVDAVRDRMREVRQLLK